jgi:hypothetical protein
VTDNALLTFDLIAQESLVVLQNQIVLANLVHRGYEEEFAKSINGYTPGSSITIKRPPRYTYREGQVMNTQRTLEGTTTLTLDQFGGVDLRFTESDLTLNMKEFSKRILEPAMRPIVTKIELSVAALYKDVWNWAGTPGQTINSYADYLKGTTRLTQLGVPMAGRLGALSPEDNAAMLGAMTVLFDSSTVKSALERAKLPGLGNTDIYECQGIRNHTVGVATGSPQVNGANQNVQYADVKDAYQQTLNTDGWTNSTTSILKQGDVFTIDGVYAVNQDSLEAQTFLQQFVVKADADSGASTGPAALTISPPIIIDGAYQTCSAAPADDAEITVVGAGGSIYPQNIVFMKEAFALAFAELEKPRGAVNVERVTDPDTGISIRFIPVYDGTNNVSLYRLDVLWGRKTINPDLATRLSGSA